jgi:voltage-gated potassium channel
MLSGIALIGVITATFASWLVERVEQVEEESRAATREDFQVLAAQLAEIRTALAASGHPEVTVAGEGHRGGR